ncbi:MAG: SMC family ATPase [Thermoleophilia bacterium]|nr:SMC family ATPase [Thermoleophilia bacterium]
MRPLHLTMQAFGPYAGTQIIDFRALGDSTFLLIHGPTGAGKTSILDAMSVALYGQTTGSERTAEQMRSQFADPDHPTALSFDFAIGGDKYRVERTPRQERPAARGSGGMVEAQPTATLWRRTGLDRDDDSGDVLASGTRAVTQAVEGLLGFSVEQFRQVVMLPQGRFRELLSANSSERQQILEELFGAQLYGGFEEFLKGKKKSAAQRLKELESRMNEALRGHEVETKEGLEGLIEAAAVTRDSAAEAERTARSAREAVEKALEEGKAVADLIRAAQNARAACLEAEGGVTRAQTELETASAALLEERGRDPERETLRATMTRLRELGPKVAELAQRTAELEQARADRDASEKAVLSAEERSQAAAAALDELRAQRLAAQQAASSLAAERPALELAEDRLRGLTSLQNLDEQIRRAGEAETQARSAQETAQRDLDRALAGLDAAESEWRAGQAAVLASTLVEGEPCPVCGSTEHPLPAHAAGALVSTEDLELAKAHVESLRATADAFREQGSGARTAVEGLRARRADAAGALGDDGTLTAAALALRIREQQARVAERGTLVDQLETAAELPPGHEEREETARLSAERAAGDKQQAEAVLETQKTAVSTLEGTVEARERDVPEEYRPPGVLAAALAEAETRLGHLDGALDRAAATEREAANALAQAEALRAREAAYAEKAERTVAGVVPPDLPSLEHDAFVARQAWETAFTEATRTLERHESLKKTLGRVQQLHAEYAALENEYSVIALLADTASSKTMTFQRWVLAAFLDEVLVAATRRLLEMSRGRYRLHQAAGPADGRRVGGLDVEVFDEFTGLDRPASTLSGGEGFLASLALALGLAEVVQNFSGGIRLDTVFIDEGFGTLDQEALDAAIETLLDLREHGRLVGVISHVPELRERIDCRLEITPGPRGSTATLVVP